MRPPRPRSPPRARPWRWRPGVSLVEPGATATELASHNRPEVLESIRSQFGQRMEAGDIANAVTYIVTRPRHVAVNEMLIRPTEQER